MKLSNRFSNPTNLLSEFDQFFNRAFQRPLSVNRESNPVGVYEADQAWLLRTDLPGFSKKDVTLRLEDGVLYLTAEREEAEHGFQSRIERTFRTPDNIDPNGITARLEDGVLAITLPKVTPDLPENLSIEVK